MPSQPPRTSRSNSRDRSRSMPSRRCPYGPAHEHPPRLWMPNTSLSMATTALWCRSRPPPRFTTKETMDSRSASGLPSTWMLGCAFHAVTARRRKSSFVGLDGLEADRFLEGEDQSRPDRLHDGGSAALFPVLGVGEVLVVVRVDVAHGAAADDIRHRVGQQLAADDEHAGRAGAADELVRREEDGVLVARRDPPPARVHLHVDIRRRRRRNPRTPARRARAAAG